MAQIDLRINDYKTYQKLHNELYLLKITKPYIELLKCFSDKTGITCYKIVFGLTC